jgi:hypothetical protein
VSKVNPKQGSNDLRDYPHVDLLFPSDYITAADLRGRDVTVVIEGIEPRHELRREGGKKDHKPVVRMKNSAKKWVLNKTNARAIAKLYGTEVMGWLGKAVTLYPTKARFGSEEVDAIRVRPRVANGPAPEQGPLAVSPPPPTRCPDCSVYFDTPDEAEAHRCQERA